MQQHIKAPASQRCVLQFVTSAASVSLHAPLPLKYCGAAAASVVACLNPCLLRRCDGCCSPYFSSLHWAVAFKDGLNAPWCVRALCMVAFKQDNMMNVCWEGCVWGNTSNAQEASKGPSAAGRRIMYGLAQGSRGRQSLLLRMAAAPAASLLPRCSRMDTSHSCCITAAVKAAVEVAAAAALC